MQIHKIRMLSGEKKSMPGKCFRPRGVCLGPAYFHGSQAQGGDPWKYAGPRAHTHEYCRTRPPDGSTEKENDGISPPFSALSEVGFGESARAYAAPL